MPSLCVAEDGQDDTVAAPRYRGRRAREADARLAPRLTSELIRDIVATIPDDFLEDVPPFATPARHREAYATHLTVRLAAPRAWVDEAEEARRAAA